MISKNFTHWIDFIDIVLRMPSGNEYTVPIDIANSVQVVGTRTLDRLPVYEILTIYKTGDAFIKDALARTPVSTTYVEDLRRLHKIQLSTMQLETDSDVRLDDWTPFGWKPRPMEYRYTGQLQNEINTMDFNDGPFLPPQPIPGPIPKIARMKSRIVYPKIFKYGDELNSRPLDMWFYLLSDDERTLLHTLGIVEIEYVSHAHGVATGKALTEYLKRNLLRLHTPTLNPFKLMYMETLFGFTDGMSPKDFYEDVLHDWMVSRVTFDSPGLLYLMLEEFKRLIRPAAVELTRINQFMASGTSRGAKIENLIEH